MYMEKSHEVKYVIQIYIFMPIIAYYMSIGGQYLQNMLVVWKPTHFLESIENPQGHALQLKP